MKQRSVRCFDGEVPFVFHKGIFLTPKLVTVEGEFGRHPNLILKRYGVDQVKVGTPLKQNGQVVYALPGGGTILASNCDGVQPK